MQAMTVVRFLSHGDGARLSLKGLPTLILKVLLFLSRKALSSEPQHWPRVTGSFRFPFLVLTLNVQHPSKLVGLMGNSPAEHEDVVQGGVVREGRHLLETQLLTAAIEAI